MLNAHKAIKRAPETSEFFFISISKGHIYRNKGESKEVIERKNARGKVSDGENKSVCDEKDARMQKDALHI